MADDVSVAIGGTISGLETALGDATSAMEALVTGPLKLLSSAFDDLGSVASGALGKIADLATTAGSDLDSMGKAALGMLTNALPKADQFTSALAKMVAIVGGGGIATAFTAITGILTYANKEMSDLVAHAEQYGLSITRIQQLQYAASLNGVGSSTFNSGVQKFVDLLDEAGRKENDLTKLFDVNNVKWKDTHGHVLDTSAALSQVATLVQRAATYSQAVKIAEWAGFSREMVPFLRQGATAIEDMAKSAPVVDDALARTRANFAREWQTTIAQWEAWFKNAIIAITPMLQGLADFAYHLIGGLGTGFANIAKGIYQMDPAIKQAERAVNTFGERFKTTLTEMTRGADTFTSEFQAASAKAFSFGGQGGPATKLLPEEDKANKDMMRSAREAAEEQLRLADLVYKGTEEKLKEQLKVHAITQHQETQQLLQALDVRHSAELAALGKEAAIAGQSLAQHQAIMDKMKTVDQKYANDRQKIMDEARAADVKGWDKTLGEIQSAFDSQLKGLLAGTTTWSQAMKNIVADLVLDIIKDFEKILIQKAALGLASTGISAGEGGIGGLLAAALPLLLAPIGLQTGAWNIPSAQLALLHPGEMVLPSGPAEQYRQGATSVAQSSTNINMNMSMYDSAGAQAMLNRIMPQLARSLQSYQALNPSRQ